MAAAERWSEWSPETSPYSVGVEEEVMLLDPAEWDLANRIDDVLGEAPDDLKALIDAETHGSVVELRTGVHAEVPSAIEQISKLRAILTGTLESLGLRAGAAGTHPTALWQDVVVSRTDRYQRVYRSMRELARREPTFALHVHVGIPDPETAIRVMNAMRIHLPVLLALGANSPFWQGRDSGLSSARTPVFQAFPRVGIPRRFEDYDDYRDSVSLLIDTDAVPEPTYLWWDIRPQPRFGTLEIRVMDAQSETWQTGALLALTQCLCRLEAEEGFVSEGATRVVEPLIENRFLASRDGIEAELIRPEERDRIHVTRIVAELLERCRPHAEALGCTAELRQVRELSRRNGCSDQLALWRRFPEFQALTEALADRFCSSAGGFE
jgi:glutamate---cysteine ligase / carboxylate-amine ligase